MGFEPRLVMSNVRLAAKIRHFGEAAMPKESVARLCLLYPAIGLTTVGKSMEKTSVIVVGKCQLGCCMCNGPKFVHVAVFSRN